MASNNTITWRNVVGPSLADAARPMELARQSLNSGFDALQRTLDTYSTAQKEGYKRDQAMKALGIREMLQGATTPEEAAAMRAQVMSQMQGIDDPTQRASVLDAVDSRQAFLRDAFIKDQQYKDQRQDVENRPIMSGIQQLMAEKRWDDARYVINAYSDRLRNGGELIKGVVDREFEVDERGQKKVEWGYRANAEERAKAAELRAAADAAQRRRLEPLEIVGKELSNEQAGATLQKTIGEITQGKPPNQLSIERHNKLIRDGEERIAGLDDRISLQANREKLFKTLQAQIKDKDKYSAIEPLIHKVLNNPDYADIRIDDLVRIAGASTTSSGWFGLGGGNNLLSELAKFKDSPEYGKGQLALNAQIASAQEEQKAAIAASRSAIEAEGRAGGAYRPLNPKYNFLANGDGQNSPASYEDYRRRLESGGNPNAKSSSSSAYGADQFTNDTWRRIVNQTQPAWANGLSDAQIQAMRSNPERSAEMARALDAQHATALKNNGLPVTHHTLYATHHFGMDRGLAFARASGDTPMKAILTNDQLAANSYLKDLTKEQAIANWDRRAGVTAPRMASVFPSPTPPVEKRPTVEDPSKEPAPTSAPSGKGVADVVNASRSKDPRDTFVPSAAQNALYNKEIEEMGDGKRQSLSPEAQKVQEHLDYQKVLATKRMEDALRREQQRAIEASRALAGQYGRSQESKKPK